MIDGLKPYPAYKDSGVPWLGMVPERWEVRRNGGLFALRKDVGRSELPILEVSLNTRVRVRDLGSSARKQMMSDLGKYQVALKGDIAYNMMRMWQGAVGVAPVDGLVSPAYVVARPLPQTEPRYFGYLFRTGAYLAEVDGYSRGIVKDRNRLYWEDFKRIPSCAPPLEDQVAIADYLDASGVQVRRYIRAKQKLIKLLEEQKQAIIHRAVARGLDPNVRLKASGLEWLGDIPQHWQTLALKRVVTKIIDCEHKTAPAVEASDFRVVRTTGVRYGRLRLSGTYFTSEEGFREWTRRGVPEAGDVIFTREAPAGEACVIPPGARVCLGQRTVLLKPTRDKYSPKFLVYMIYSGPPRDNIAVASQGSTVSHFNMEDIAALPVLVPPLLEQLEIVSHVGDATRSLEVMQGQAEREIELLREFRTRLIADVVTGKLDVREAAAKLPEEPNTEPEEPIDDIADVDAEVDDAEATVEEEIEA